MFKISHMKRILAIIISSLLLNSCSKNNDTPVPPGFANNFVGNWSVDEKVTTSPLGYYSSTSLFNGTSFKKNDSIFVVDQSLRTPKPVWASGFADSIDLKPIILSRALNWVTQGNIGSYSENMDTLSFTYIYGNTGSYVYVIKQKWVRQ